MFLFLGCGKEIIIIQTVPPELGPTTVVAFGDSLRLTSTIRSLGSLPVDRYGFAISASTFGLGSPLDIALPSPISSNTFSATIAKPEGENQYAVAGFILTKEDTVFGEKLILDGKDRNPPLVQRIEPTHGYKGDVVKITGANFGNNKMTLKVTLGNQNAEILSSTDDQILAKIPRYSNSGVVNLLVDKGQKTSNSVSFRLDGPAISSFTPHEGSDEFTFTIHGGGFSEVSWRNSVTLSIPRSGTLIRYPAQVTTATSNQITAKLNAKNILPGSYALSIETDDVTAIAAAPFLIKSPWRQLRSLPTDGLMESANFEINGKLYVCGGTSAPISASYSNQLWEYDATTDTWTRKADFPGGARVGSFAFSLGNKGYVGSGIDTQDNRPSDFWQYDPLSDRWTQKAAVPDAPRANAHAFAYNNKGYVILGTHFFWSTFKGKDFWSYDDTQDTWTRLPDFPGKARVRSAFGVKNNKLFVFGGHDPITEFKSDSWSYNFETQQWSFIGYIDFQTQAFTYDSQKSYLLTLSLNYFLESELNFYEYDPETNTKTASRSLFPGKFRWLPGLMMIQNQKIYVGFGVPKVDFGFSNNLNDLWVYPLQP